MAHSIAIASITDIAVGEQSQPDRFRERTREADVVVPRWAVVDRRRSLPRIVGAWSAFSRPRSMFWFMGGVLVCDLGFAVFACAVTPARVGEIATFGALVVCAVTCVEAMRRLGTPSGLARDLLGAWWLPTLLLLPPLYALLIPIPVYMHLQYRIHRTLVHRRVFNAGSVALAGFVASWTFSMLQGDGALQAFVMPTHVAGASLLTPAGLIGGLLCCALFTLVNTGFVAVAVRLSAPETPWRRLLWDREALVIDCAEMCVGTTVAVLAGVSVPLLVLALPPVMLLQRSLLYEQLQAAARTDPKTGLLNAATWERESQESITRALGSRSPVTVLLTDIDHFKRVNDTYGHMFGDQVLLGVAKTLTHHLRPSDLLGRFGGEEFVALLPNADMAEACRVAERLRSRVERMEMVSGGKNVTVTVSIGVALFTVHGDDVLELLASADHALYRAKDAGRNRVRMPPTGPWAIAGGTGGNQRAPAEV